MMTHTSWISLMCSTAKESFGKMSKLAAAWTQHQVEMSSMVNAIFSRLERVEAALGPVMTTEEVQRPDQGPRGAVIHNAGVGLRSRTRKDRSRPIRSQSSKQTDPLVKVKTAKVIVDATQRKQTFGRTMTMTRIPS